MTPQREEAQRLLRLAVRDREAFEILAASGGKAHSAAGFHAQQAVEKALLCLMDIDFPRTHDLENLLNRLAGSGPVPTVSPAQLRPLTPYAVDFRYDDESVQLLPESEMRSLVAVVIGFVVGELGE